MDQHAHAWSRCLNSCLLTLAAATLAIQKIAEQSVKEEVLESKEGATYFSGMEKPHFSTTLKIKINQVKSYDVVQQSGNLKTQLNFTSGPSYYYRHSSRGEILEQSEQCTFSWP